MTFLEVIQSAPKVIQDILDSRDDQIVNPIEHAFKSHTFSSVVVIASGTSYNAAATVKKYAEQSLNVKMELFYPNMFLNYANTNLVDKKSLVVFISQGGTTKEVYYCVESICVVVLLGSFFECVYFWLEFLFGFYNHSFELLYLGAHDCYCPVDVVYSHGFVTKGVAGN